MFPIQPARSRNATPHPRAQPLPAPTGATQVIAISEISWLLSATQAPHAVYGVGWCLFQGLSILGKELLVCFASASFLKTGICLYFQRGRTIVWELRKPRFGSSFWESLPGWPRNDIVPLPQFLTSKTRIVAALTERCAGRTQSNIHEVFEYHGWEGRGAQKHIQWQIYVSFTVICMSCSLCHASSIDPKIKNSMGASKEQDSFLKWVRWHANPLIVWLSIVLHFLMDKAKKQVEQVWMSPSYDTSDNGMCDSVIKQNCTSRSSTWGSYTMGGKKKKLIKGT